MLKVLHICRSDLNGGAAIAAYRLHKALLEKRVDSRMVVLEKLSNDPTVIAPLGILGRSLNYVARLASRGMRALEFGHGDELRSINWANTGLSGWINTQPVDVINLHWVGAELLSLAEIAKIRAPIVWTLHDMWAFCGTEHYAGIATTRHQSGYTPDSRKKGGRGFDVDAWNYRRKSRFWSNKTFHLVGPSQWMATEARKSSLFTRMPIHLIPNGIDPEIFSPTSRTVAREALKLPTDHRYILFGATNATKDPRKGFSYLMEALRKLDVTKFPNKKLELLVFGSTEDATQLSAKCQIPVRSVGNVSDPRALAQVYSAASIFVAPSLQDNLPNTLLEAHACGTPCVAFDVGGIRDIIAPYVTGILSPAIDCEGLASAIENALELNEDLARAACRAHAVRHFSVATMATRYTELYNSIHKLQ